MESLALETSGPSPLHDLGISRADHGEDSFRPSIIRTDTTLTQLEDAIGLSAPVSPVTPTEESHIRAASMTSIPLSDASSDYSRLSAEQIEDALATPKPRLPRHLRRPSSLEILQNAAPAWATPDEGKSSVEYGFAEAVSIRSNSTTTSVSIVPARTTSIMSPVDFAQTRRESTSSGSSREVNWAELDANEESSKTDVADAGEDESTAFLLARLEQENAMLTSDPKSAVQSVKSRGRSYSRPPSIHHLRNLVENPAPSIRYSLAPSEQLPEEPPPMTELEFWAALVQDYPQTAARLPTLTTTKIRAGIPPPLRGVVWLSIAGARDRNLEEEYETLLTQKSPFEGAINKDIGRSFPGVEMFMDPEGEGQKMLGRVLKCFSLHDKDIGYCQGLGFLVGPLLMQMGEREAFCVLVRLMEHYTLRPSFLPSLSGLHLRIYQFSALLAQHHVELSTHLGNLGVEPAYLSQWFLSCFAVTCPLPMLFRIYDVIFAEGANETVMRVALALMRRNEAKMLAAKEFEDVMSLLLGRQLWDPYGCDADSLVDDFTSVGNAVTHDRLAELEREFEAKSSETVGQSAGFLPDVQAAASRFLGRLWAPSHSTSKSTATLSPGTAESGRGSFLRRSPSKQSLASTLNESDSSGSSSLASTAVTEPDRTDSLDAQSLKDRHAVSKEDRDLHGQIEDLLTALSEMQREHAQMAAMLQKEREDRTEDHRVVRRLVGRLQPPHESKATTLEERRRTLPPPVKSIKQSEQPKEVGQATTTSEEDRRRTMPPTARLKEEEPLNGLLESVQERLETNKRFSASFETKAQLRDTITRTREQLVNSEAHAADLTNRVEAAEKMLTTFEAEATDLRNQLNEGRRKSDESEKERQRLMQQVQSLQARVSIMPERKGSFSGQDFPTLRRLDTSSSPESRRRGDSISSAGGLRELRLGRTDSTHSLRSVRNQNQPTTSREPSPASPTVPTLPIAFEKPAEKPKPTLNLPQSERAVVFAKRTSSLATQAVLATPEHEPVPEEALLLELVNAKTAEAQAHQEVDELRRQLAVQARRQAAEVAHIRAEAQRELEAAKGAHSLSTPVTPSPRPSTDGSPVTTPGEAQKPLPAPPGGGGGGWFWGKRAASSGSPATETK